MVGEEQHTTLRLGAEEVTRLWLRLLGCSSTVGSNLALLSCGQMKLFANLKFEITPLLDFISFSCRGKTCFFSL
jgi:hypothetical protein